MQLLWKIKHWLWRHCPGLICDCRMGVAKAYRPVDLRCPEALSRRIEDAIRPILDRAEMMDREVLALHAAVRHMLHLSH